MADIQSAAAEIRRGKKEERKKQDKNIRSTSATQGGHNNTAEKVGATLTIYLFTIYL